MIGAAHYDRKKLAATNFVMGYTQCYTRLGVLFLCRYYLNPNRAIRFYWLGFDLSIIFPH